MIAFVIWTFNEMFPTAIHPKTTVSRAVVFVLILFAITVLPLWKSDVFSRELTGTPDEAAHFVTGLMIRDYIGSSAEQSPHDFALQFYAHYPKVAFGMWPPLFHIAEAVWMSVFGRSKIAVFLMLCTITTALAWSVWSTVAPALGGLAGLLPAILLISAPLMQAATFEITVDSAVALGSFLATLHFGRYLDSNRTRDLAWFAIWTCIAILTKYNGLALFFMPPFAILLSGQLHFFRRRPFWIASSLTLMVCAAWYVPFRHFVSYAADPKPSVNTILPALLQNVSTLSGLLGLPMLGAACIGLWFTVFKPREMSSQNGLWTSCAALIIGSIVFHSISTPDPAPRYLVQTLAPVTMFVAAGVLAVSRVIRSHPVLIACALGFVYLAGTYKYPVAHRVLFGTVAQRLIHDTQLNQSVVLVDGSPRFEGVVVSEIAEKEAVPAIYVLRAGKVFARQDWMGARYSSAYQNTAQVRRVLDDAGVTLIILDLNEKQSTLHRSLLVESLQSFSEWKEWTPVNCGGCNSDFAIYRRNAARNNIERRVKLFLHESLGEDVEIVLNRNHAVVSESGAAWPIVPSDVIDYPASSRPPLRPAFIYPKPKGPSGL